MPEIRALQHIYSSVERGYFPHQPRGFQTVSLSRELIHSADLQALERAAVYSLNSERRRASDFPVKETFFVLPSGASAVGRIRDSGTDSMGREGNYIAHHLIISHDELTSASASPFAILDCLSSANDTDLTPRDLQPVIIDLPAGSFSIDALTRMDSEFAANLMAAVTEKKDKTVLLIGKESRSVIAGLLASLPAEERTGVTFSTHFFESGHLRSLFSVVAADSRAEAPSQRQDYFVFDLEEGSFPRIPITSAFSGWISQSAKSGRWDEIRSFNQVLNQLRSSESVIASPPTITRPACGVLWEKAGLKAARALVGNADSICNYMVIGPSRREIAEVLLTIGSPSEVCGKADEDIAKECLSLLSKAAPGRAWKVWVERWKNDPLLALASDKKSWWRVWG
jgi:hypothetical protein